MSTAEYFVPRLLGLFHHEHSGIAGRLRVANNCEQLVALMGSGEVDLSVIGQPPKEVATRSECCSSSRTRPATRLSLVPC